MSLPPIIRRVLRRVAREARKAPLLLSRISAPKRRSPASSDDPSTLPPSLRDLPDTLDYVGEFGAELILFLPWCNWLSAAGLLRGRRLRIYRGMRCFYAGMDCLEIVEKDDVRHYIAPRRRQLPISDEHIYGRANRSPFLMYPDLRRDFAGFAAPAACEASGRPLVIVHNKYNHEWDGPPVNYIPLDCLDSIFERLTARFTVLYIRHGMADPKADFSSDEMNQLPFDDRGVLTRHPNVLCFDDLYAAHRAAGGAQDVNSFKNAIYARCHRFVTAQGGGAHHIALFSGALMILLHLRGRETELAYGDGYYDFMTNPAPLRAICHSAEALLDGLALLDDSTVVDGRVLIDTRHARLLRRLSPWPAERLAPA